MKKIFLKKSQITQDLVGITVTLIGIGRKGKNRTGNPNADITFKITSIGNTAINGEVILDSNKLSAPLSPGGTVTYFFSDLQDDDLFISKSECLSCLQL